MSNEISNFVGNALDFEKVYERAVTIFSEQTMLNKDPDKVTLKDIELSRSKAANFLDAISGVLEIGHQVEVLSAETNKFKRKDELEILQDLLLTCKKQAKFVSRNIDLAQERLEELYETEDPDSEQIALLSNIMNCSIDSSQKIISSMARLVQLERMSGSRPYGNSKSNISHYSSDSNDEKKELPAKPRKLTKEDLQNID